jgi:hypothetical protein
MSLLLKLFHKIEREGTLPNSNNTLKAKLDKKYNRK